MAIDERGSLLFPVGHLVGPSRADPMTAAGYLRVRVGTRIARLTTIRAGIWGLAHGMPDHPLGAPWTRRDVVARAQEGVSDVERLIDDLLLDGMLVETRPGTDSAVDFAERHRVIPLTFGLGTDAADPRYYSVGAPGHPVMQMPGVLYDVLAHIRPDVDLWTACAARRPSIAEPAATDPNDRLDLMLRSLHPLLMTHAVCLDVTIDEVV